MHTTADVNADEKAAESRELDPMQDQFCIGDWLVKPQLNQLQHLLSGETRHLEPRLAKLLCYLAANAQQVIDRDTLVAVLWPRVIVNENSLTRAVSELRKQLAWQGDKQTYIETIPKRGYRLLQSAVASEADAGSHDAADLPQVPGWMRQVTQATPQSGFLAFGLAVVLAGWLGLGQTLNQQALPVLSDELIPSSNGVIGASLTLSKSENQPLKTDGIAQPVFAGDQERFAYIQYGHTGSTIYIGEIASDYEPVPVFNSQDILYNLTWSPLGNSLLFASKPVLTTTALFEKQAEATLYALNLDSLELNELIEQAPSRKDGSQMDLSLT